LNELRKTFEMEKSEKTEYMSNILKDYEDFMAFTNSIKTSQHPALSTGDKHDLQTLVQECNQILFGDKHS